MSVSTRPGGHRARSVGWSVGRSVGRWTAYRPRLDRFYQSATAGHGPGRERPSIHPSIIPRGGQSVDMQCLACVHAGKQKHACCETKLTPNKTGRPARDGRSHAGAGPHSRKSADEVGQKHDVMVRATGVEPSPAQSCSSEAGQSRTRGAKPSLVVGGRDGAPPGSGRVGSGEARGK